MLVTNGCGDATSLRGDLGPGMPPRTPLRTGASPTARSFPAPCAARPRLRNGVTRSHIANAAQLTHGGVQFAFVCAGLLRLFLNEMSL